MVGSVQSILPSCMGTVIPRPTGFMFFRLIILDRPPVYDTVQIQISDD